MTTPTCKQLGITLSEETNNTLLCVQWNEDVYMHWSQNHACTEVAGVQPRPSTHAEMYWSAGTLLLTLTTASAASIFNVSSLESSVILIALVMSRGEVLIIQVENISFHVLYLRVIFVAIFVCVCTCVLLYLCVCTCVFYFVCSVCVYVQSSNSWSYSITETSSRWSERLIFSEPPAALS